MKTAKQMTDLTCGFAGTMPMDIKDCLVLFARQHVEAALKAASENAQLEATGKYEIPYIVDKDSILNAYPESNIV